MIKLTEQLRSQKDAPELIIMSALGSPCIIKESLAKGVFSFMKKPLQIYKLLYARNGAVEIAKIKSAAANRMMINAATMCHPLQERLNLKDEISQMLCIGG